jgi:hypothetical protein
MNSSHSTFAEFLKTGVLGVLKTGMTIDHVKCAIGEPSWIHPSSVPLYMSYGSLEIYFEKHNRDWIVDFIKLPLKHFAGLPSAIEIDDYFPKRDTTLAEFEAYLQTQVIEYVVLWQNIKETRYPIVHTRPRNLYIQFDEDTLLIGSAFCHNNLIPLRVHVASHVALTIFGLINGYVLQSNQGIVFPSGYSYYLGGNEDGIQPSVSYKANRLDVTQLIDLGVPDLAIEVCKPQTDLQELLGTVRRCFESGTKEFWMVFPMLRMIYQYKSSKPDSFRIYRGSETIDAEDLFPGIQGLTTDAIFNLPNWVTNDSEESES